MNYRELSESSRARLISDVKAVVADAEAYLAASIGQTGEAYEVARTRLERTIADTHRVLGDKTRAAARATNTYAHEKPWQSIAVGAAVGLLVGLLMGRRGSENG